MAGSTGTPASEPVVRSVGDGGAHAAAGGSPGAQADQPISATKDVAASRGPEPALIAVADEVGASETFLVTGTAATAGARSAAAVAVAAPASSTDIELTDPAALTRIRSDLLYFHFYRRALQLRTADLSGLSMSERVCFFLNVMMALQVHAVLALGRPVTFFDRCCEAVPSYLIGGEAMTVDDITSTVFRQPPPAAFFGSRSTAGCAWTVAYAEEDTVAMSVSSMQVAVMQRASEHVAKDASLSFPVGGPQAEPSTEFGPTPMRDCLPTSWSTLLYFAQISCTKGAARFRVFHMDSLEESLITLAREYLCQHVVVQADGLSVSFPEDMRRFVRLALGRRGPANQPGRRGVDRGVLLTLCIMRVRVRACGAAPLQLR